MRNLEENKICPFGLALLEARKAKGMSSARLSMKSETFSSHLLHIERGTAEPSIMVALRLVIALKIDTSAFFRALAVSQSILPLESQIAPVDENFCNTIVEKILATASLNSRSLFGLLFKQVRKHYKLTQKQISESSGYAIRNIQKVENEGQNPSVMTALAMVCAVAEKSQTDIGVFFNAYQQILQEISKD